MPYASLMLVDVVAIPPAGSPFFRFVQRHPDVLGELPGYIHRALVRDPTEVGEKLTGLIPGATLQRIDGAGHLVHYDAPVALMDRLRVWLASQVGLQG